MKYQVSYRTEADAYSSSYDKGIGTKTSVIVHAVMQKPTSQLWFCPICGSVYVNVNVYPSTKFIAVCNECEYCTKNNELLYKTRTTLPGSILMEGYNTIDELSSEMLIRELLIELKAMEYLINQGIL